MSANGDQLVIREKRIDALFVMTTEYPEGWTAKQITAKYNDLFIEVRRARDFLRNLRHDSNVLEVEERRGEMYYTAHQKIDLYAFFTHLMSKNYRCTHCQ